MTAEFVGFISQPRSRWLSPPSAGVLPSEPTPREGPFLAFVVTSVFKRQPRATRFLQNLFGGVIYVAAGLATVANVFDMPVGGLLAAFGVIAILLDVALQSTLGDVFSGIVLNVAKPYHPGDWIILDGGTQGCVVETDWRATHILTPDNDLAIIPNSVMAKARLINASQPVRAHGLTIIIRLEPTVTPSGGRVALQVRVYELQSDLADARSDRRRSKPRRSRGGTRHHPRRAWVSDFRGYQ